MTPIDPTEEHFDEYEDMDADKKTKNAYWPGYPTAIKTGVKAIPPIVFLYVMNGKFFEKIHQIDDDSHATIQGFDELKTLTVQEKASKITAEKEWAQEQRHNCQIGEATVLTLGLGAYFLANKLATKVFKDVSFKDIFKKRDKDRDLFID